MITFYADTSFLSLDIVNMLMGFFIIVLFACKPSVLKLLGKKFSSIQKGVSTAFGEIVSYSRQLSSQPVKVTTPTGCSSSVTIADASDKGHSSVNKNKKEVLPVRFQTGSIC